MPTGPFYIGVTLGALLAEAAFGYPAPLFRAIRHPVVWIGAPIGRLDRGLNRAVGAPWRRRAAGIAALLTTLLATTALAALLQAVLLRCLPLWAAWMVLSVAAGTLLAQRSLHGFVAAVGEGLRQNGLPGARRAVAHIVGRNPESLDESGVIRAAIESLAENFSDGVVAPALWCCVGGLPGIVLYKTINTADSMIGHRTPRHEVFGWAAARLDDLVNLPASRLAALWLIAAACLRRGCSPRAALRAVRRDARRHRSPNAGWPESAMAGALGLRLAGPRVYGHTRIEDAWMGDGRADAAPDDIRRALTLYRTAGALQIAALAALGLFIARG